MIIRHLTEILRQGRRYRKNTLGPLGLNCSHSGCLVEIADHPGLSQDQLAQLLCLDKSTVARRVAALEEEGYVERLPSGRDKRVMELMATPKAQEVLPSIRQILLAWDEYLTEGMTPEECQTLEKLLERVKDRAAAWRKDEADV